MDLSKMLLTDLVRQNPSVHAAWYDDAVNPSTVHVLSSDAAKFNPLDCPPGLSALRVIRHYGKPISTLRAPVTQARAANVHQTCQNEPVSAGTQIQPQGANWVGTAGAPVSWTGPNGQRCWGLLSNWHVLADGDERVGRTAHQPVTSQPAIARLARWCGPTPGEVNDVDAAVADARIDGKHTISNSILGIGILGATPLTATVGLKVSKAGRTTGVTHGECVAVGASVAVGYGDFVATFEDQDIFAGDSAEFSAPGDSGSMIVGRSCRCATSLLFAGSTELTVGNPIRHVARIMSLIFPFN